MRNDGHRTAATAADSGRPRHFVMALVSLALLWGIPAFAAESSRKPILRVLFVGNSYLYVNDLPSQVRRLAAAKGVALDARMLAQPDAALSDHLRSPGFLSTLDQKWDWIVLQQGPSSLPGSRDELIASVKAVATHVRGRPVRIGLMSGWPAKQHVAGSARGEASYRMAAAESGACVMPVATAWRLARESKKPPTLYAPDRLHATRTGTRLAALVVLHGLAGGDPLRMLQDDADALPALKRIDVLEQAVVRAFEAEPEGCRPD